MLKVRTMTLYGVSFLFLAVACGRLTYGELGIQSEIVKEYLNLCPTINTCNATATKPHRPTPQIGSSTYFLPCCDTCSCEEDCGHNCCPDKPEIEYTLPDSSVEKLDECVGTNYRRDESSLYFIMVTKCPGEYETTEIRWQCEEERFNSSSDITIANVIPVTVGMVAYKNRMCATCNNKREEDFIYWTAKFFCKFPLSFLPSSPAEILRLAEDSRSTCDIEYIPPLSVEGLIACANVIDRCNVSGTWKLYDPTVEMACHSYKSIYGQKYKNVHCFLCNGYTLDDVNMLCEYDNPQTGTSSFVALLDFNRLEKKSEASKSVDPTCPEDTIYNPIMGNCLNLTCGHGLVLNDNKCVSLYQSVRRQGNWMVYGLTVALIPRDPESIMPANIAYLHDDLKEVIENTTRNIGLSPCSVSSFIRARTSVRKLILNIYTEDRTFVTSDIEYIAFDIRVKEFNPDNISSTIILVEDAFRQNLNTSEYVVTFRSISGYLFDKALGSRSNRDELETNMIMSLPFREYDALRRGFDQLAVGVLPFLDQGYTRDCHVSYAIDFDTLCPKIELPCDEYNVSFNHGTVRIKGIEQAIDHRRVSLSDIGDTIRLCVKDFMRIVDGIGIEEDETITYSPLVILTIICISLSLLSLLLTLIVYCLFVSLRTVPGLNNMGLVLSLIVSQSLTLVNALTNISTLWVCRLVGIALHFALLSSFSWMFVCTFHMARVFASLKLKSASDSKVKVFIHYVLFSEIASALVVAATVLVSHLTSGGATIGYTEKPCYVEPDKLVYIVAIPVALVVVLNFAIFAYVIITISRLPDMRKNSTQERQNIAIFAKLSTLTGLTWILGFVYQFTNVEVFAYLFTIVNASQGIFIMVSFVLNRRVYEMVRKRRDYTSSNSHSNGVSNTSKSVKTVSTGQLATISNTDNTVQTSDQHENPSID